MRKCLVAAACLLAFAGPAWAQSPAPPSSVAPAPDYSSRALAQTLQEVMQAFIATRADLFKAQATIADLEAKLKTPGAPPAAPASITGAPCSAHAPCSAITTPAAN